MPHALGGVSVANIFLGATNAVGDTDGLLRLA